PRGLERSAGGRRADPRRAAPAHPRAAGGRGPEEDRAPRLRHRCQVGARRRGVPQCGTERVAALIETLSARAAAPAAVTHSQPQKLRVGLVLAAERQPRWVIDAFAKVAAAQFAEIAAIAVVSDGNSSREKSSVLLQMYASVDRWAFGAD